MLTFNDYKKMAKDHSLSHREKIGFADIHRKEFEKNIFIDIKHKLQLPTQIYQMVSTNPPPLQWILRAHNQ